MDIAKEMKENVFCLPESIKESAEKCRKQYNSLKQANLKFEKNSKETGADSKKKPAHFEDVYDIEKDKDSYRPKFVSDCIDDPKSSDEILSEQETEFKFSKFDLKIANKNKMEKVWLKTPATKKEVVSEIVMEIKNFSKKCSEEEKILQDLILQQAKEKEENKKKRHEEVLEVSRDIAKSMQQLVQNMKKRHGDD